MSSYDKPEALDSAIDAAVRDMVLIDPRPGLRQRVAGSIGARPRHSFTVRFRLPALAAAMVLLVSLLILRPSDPPPPVHAPQVAETPPAVPANPLAGPQTAGPRTAGPQMTERAPVSAASTPRVATTVPASPAVPRRRSSPTPESIFGGRSDRVAAASLPAASATEHNVQEMAPEFQAFPGAFGITPLRLEPIHVMPITIQPLSLNNVPRR